MKNADERLDVKKNLTLRRAYKKVVALAGTKKLGTSARKKLKAIAPQEKNF